MLSVTVVVPWRDGCSHREDAWRWVRERYGAQFPDWQVSRSQSPPGPFNRAAAIMAGVEGAGGTVVVADGDVWCDGLGDAVACVQAGARWAVPHRRVHRLTVESTAAVLRGETPTPEMATVRRPYRGVAGGGVVVASRATLLEVPFDRRFVGWGGEDGAWRAAMQTLVGSPWRGEHPLWHLWHPPQRRMNGKVASPESQRLYDRYKAAHGDREAMQALLGAAP